MQQLVAWGVKLGMREKGFLGSHYCPNVSKVEDLQVPASLQRSLLFECDALLFQDEKYLGKCHVLLTSVHR